MRPSVRTLGGRCNGKIIISFLMFEQLLALAATQLSFQCGTKSINQKNNFKEDIRFSDDGVLAFFRS